MNYYNEFDPHAAAWLRELINQKLIPAGVVDTRSITEVTPNDLHSFTQCHFFAGIGGWSLALQLAGWPADRPVWTGSCPCQPFSTAGKQLGDQDERHLWPVFFDLIKKCRPEHVFGEQVANAIGKGWLDGISADLESENYACGAVVLGAHSVGAPHIRQRLYWVADSQLQHERPTRPHEARTGDAAGLREAHGLANMQQQGLERLTGDGDDGNEPGWVNTNTVGPVAEGGAASDGVEQPNSRRLRFSEEQHREQEINPANRSSCREHADRLGGHLWSDYELVYCRDGKTRRVPTEPAFFPLAHGVPARVVRLRGYGNAIVPQAAAEFTKAYLETAP